MTQVDVVSVLQKFLLEHKELHPLTHFRTAIEATKNRIRRATLGEPLKGLALRCSGAAFDAFFMGNVCSWKVFHISRALVAAFESVNPVAVAALTRSLIEHLASLCFVCHEIGKLLHSLEGQNSPPKVSAALTRAELVLTRAYYGESSKSKGPKKAEAIHVNDCLTVLEYEVADIYDVYDYLCEYVHPNHGSNRLVSRGELGCGDLEPEAGQLNATIVRIASYCSSALRHFEDVELRLARLCVLLEELSERALAPGCRMENWLSRRPAKPDGDGKTKETAFFFPKARTNGEAVAMIYKFFEDSGIRTTGIKKIGAVENDFIFDVFPTEKGTIWFKIPIAKR